MKQSDIITIVLITMIGTIAAGFAVNAILGNPDDAKETWKTIKVVESSLTQPNPDTFNADAVNPTVEVYVGNCIDQDQDGKLSEEEQIACGWRSSKRIIVNEQGEKVLEETTEKPSSENSENGTTENSSSSTVVTPITVEEILRQREAQQQSSSTNTEVPTSPVTTPTEDGTETPSVTPTVPGTIPGENSSTENPSTENNSGSSSSGNSGSSGNGGQSSSGTGDIPVVEL